MSFPAKGQSVTLLMLNMDRRWGSNDGGNQSRESEKSMTHGEGRLLNEGEAEGEDFRGSRGPFMDESWVCRSTCRPLIPS